MPNFVFGLSSAILYNNFFLSKLVILALFRGVARYLKVARSGSYLKSCIIRDATTPVKSSFDVSNTWKKVLAKIPKLVKFFHSSPMQHHSQCNAILGFLKCLK